MSLAVQFLAATHPKEKSETLWTFCPCYGVRVEYILKSQDGDKKVFVCPDCGRTIERAKR